MLILTIPVLAFFYCISSVDSFSKKFFGTLLWANILFFGCSLIPLIDGTQLLKSVLIAIPITIIIFYSVIKFLDLGIKACDYILKKTS